MECKNDAYCKHENRQCRRHHAHAQTSDDVGCCARRRLAYNAQYRFFSGTRIIFRDQTHQQTGDETNNGCIKNFHSGHFQRNAVKFIYKRPGFRQHSGDDEPGKDDHQDGRTKFADVERSLRIATFFHPYEKSTKDGSQDAHTRQGQRQQYSRKAIEVVAETGSGHEDSAQYHCRNNGTYIGFEQVGAHTRYVAHVIAYVIGNSCRVQRVVFRNAGFYFTYKVSANVGSFGINTAANTGKQSNRRSAERKAGDDRNHAVNALVIAGSEHLAINDEQRA